MQNSDKVQRKFIESYDVDDFEILADDGWHDIKSVHKTVKYTLWHIVTEHHELTCADDHILFDCNMQEVFAKDLAVGQKIQTENGLEAVICVEALDDEDNMYDVQVDSEQHRYYTNGILSHNTTCYSIFCLWLATLFSERRIMVTANKLATAIEVMDRIRLSYDYLPKWLKPKTTIYNKGEIAFSNKSIIRATATSSSASRGFSCNVLCIDELAFIPPNIVDEFWASVIPIVSSDKNSKIIAVSTPNGATGKYYDLWQQANSKEASKNLDGWTPFRIDWWEVPGRDEKWKQQQIATIGKDKWLQEFCNEFVAGSSTHKLVPDEKIEAFRREQTALKTKGELDGKTMKIPSADGQREFSFTMWHEFVPGHAYVAASDVAEGTGGDSSVLYVFDISDIRHLTMCAKFAAPSVSTIEFAYLTDRILKLYNKPWLICESNGIGSGYLDSLRVTYAYDNIVREGKEGKCGITSHVQVKGKACLWLNELFTTRDVSWKIYDTELVDEMCHFVRKDSKMHAVYSATPGSHDDHMMALVWAAWMLNPDVIEKYYMVVTTVKTDLEKFLPLQIAPLKEATNEEISNVVNDPFYVEYMKFKQEVMQKLGEITQEKKVQQLQQKRKPSFNQLFFGDEGGDDWGSPWVPMSDSMKEPSAQQMLQMPTSQKPMCFVF